MPSSLKIVWQQIRSIAAQSIDIAAVQNNVDGFQALHRLRPRQVPRYPCSAEALALGSR
ncbi:hypothetical protein [Agathobaculum sp. Marseille-P7918]|uniref:hypothetical protein n=1 Tax=Agathobaculum sp. Marseille-P7918 TaxID=2479843 RepID=UPI0035699702